ncbi:MAG: hypothetical protein WCE61_06740 [Candidatus Acidiferrum sp.]
MQTGMVRPDDDFGRDYGLVHEAIVTGRKAGAGREFWAKLAHDRNFFEKVVRFVRHVDLVGTTHHRASQIMGQNSFGNFFGVAEAIQHFHVIPYAYHLDDLSRIPFSERTLEECCDTHVLVAVFPLSINQIRNRLAANHGTFFSGSRWSQDQDQPYAIERGKTEWQLVRKTPVPNSIGPMTWEQRMAKLGTDEEVPRARILAYMMAGYYLLTGEPLFRNVRVFSADRTTPTTHVYLGGLDPTKSEGKDYDGLASARKPE